MISLPPLPDGFAHLCQSWALAGVGVLAQTSLVLTAGLAATWLVGRQRRGPSATGSGPLLRAAICRATLLAVAAVVVLAPLSTAQHQEKAAPLTLRLPGLPQDFTLPVPPTLPRLAFLTRVPEPESPGLKRVMVFTSPEFPAAAEKHTLVFARAPEVITQSRSIEAAPGRPLNAALPYLYAGAVFLYVAGLAMKFGTLLAGRTRLRRLAMASETASPESPLARIFTELCATADRKNPARVMIVPPGAAGSDAPFLADSRVLLPRPVLFLPAEARSWSETEARAILAHEAAHLLRRDGAWMLFGRVFAALLWPQPLLALLLCRLEEAAEEACDAEAVASGACDGTTLARCLLSIATRRAETSRSPLTLLAPAAAASRFRSSLGRRVAGLLAADEAPRRGRPGLTGAASTLIVAAACTLPLAALHGVGVEAHSAAVVSDIVRRDVRFDLLPPPPSENVTFVRVVRKWDAITVTGTRVPSPLPRERVAFPVEVERPQHPSIVVREIVTSSRSYR